MDVLITMSPPAYVEGETIWVPFVAIGRSPGQAPLALEFRVAFAFGTTLAQKRTGIIMAAGQARAAYEAAHGLSLPAVASIEILGI